MNRRSFLTTAARLTATGAALAVAANTPLLLTETPQPVTTSPTKKPAIYTTAKQPTRGCDKRLPMYASHTAIRSASLWALMNWWGQYGCAIQAPNYRDVPRSYVRETMLLKYSLVAEEHIYG